MNESNFRQYAKQCGISEYEVKCLWKGALKKIEQIAKEEYPHIPAAAYEEIAHNLLRINLGLDKSSTGCPTYKYFKEEYYIKEAK
jgi:hypothetical protein